MQVHCIPPESNVSGAFTTILHFGDLKHQSNLSTTHLSIQYNNYDDGHHHHEFVDDSDDDDPNESECETKELALLLMISNQQAGRQKACLQPDKRPTVPANRREMNRNTRIKYKIQNNTNI